MAVAFEASAAVIAIEITQLQLSNRHRNIPGDLLPHYLLLFDHANCLPLDLIELELDLVLGNDPLDLSDLLDAPLFTLERSLFDGDHLGADLHLGSRSHLLHHLDPCLLLHFLTDDGLLLLDRFHLIAHLCLFFGLFLQNEPFDCFFDRPQHLLLSLDSLHLPFGLCSESVLVFLVHVAVLVPMHLVSQTFLSAVAATRRAARLRSGLLPVGARLVVGLAAATAARGLARPAALAAGVLQGAVLRVRAVGDARLILGAPVAPAIHVVTPDAARQPIPGRQLEGTLLEVADVDGPCGKRAWDDGQVGIDTVRPFALHLSLVEGAARDGRVPRHLLLRTEGLVGRYRDGAHLLWD